VLKRCESKLAILGIEAPARLSLSCTNGHRSWELFETVAAKAVGKKKFRFKNKLANIDSAVIDLYVSVYDWAKLRTTKGGVEAATAGLADLFALGRGSVRLVYM
jgi:hypothetical protein